MIFDRAIHRFVIPHRIKDLLASLVVQTASALQLSLFITFCWLGFSTNAQAAGGSYAAAGTGNFADSLWWLDFTGYNDATAGAGGQTFSFTLPNNAGTLTTTVTRTGTTTMAAVASPAWTGGGAFGHGAYNGITGTPTFYWLNQTGTGTVTLSSLVMRDAAGNPRTFSMYAADGENTDQAAELNTYNSTVAWQLIDNINYYPGFTGSSVGVAGIGTTSVRETAPATGSTNFNGSIILGTNNPSQISTSLLGSQGALYAVSLPTVALTVSIPNRIDALDQVSSTGGYTSPVAIVRTVNSTGAATSATTGALSLIGSNSVTLSAAMAAGSASTLSNYTGAISCTNTGKGAASYGGTATVLPSGAGTSFTLTPQTGDKIACVLTLSPVPQPVGGTVYGDTNHNANQDAGEVSTAIAGLNVKLATLSGGVCQNPALQTAPVTTSTGAYSFSAVPPGAYCLILTNSTALSNTTAYAPPGWISTEAAAGVRQLTVRTNPPAPQNFGLYNGSQLIARVFGDSGQSNGTANDGVQNGTEPNLSNVVTNATSGGSVVATSTTDASGNVVLWLSASTTGIVVITPAAPSGYVATGGSAGTTTGSYTRPSVSFTMASGQTYSGVSFGLIPPNTLSPDGAETLQPGTVFFYPHTFVAGSAGQVGFSTSSIANPAVAGWAETLYRDTNCNGLLDAAETQITGQISVVAGQQLCLLLKEFVPANAPLNAQNKITLFATTIYSGAAAPATNVVTRVDVTTVASAGALRLVKQVQNLTTGTALGTNNNALPGNILQYQLSLTNQGSSPLTTLLVNDATPAFTTFLSAACPAPTAVACSVSSQPTVGGQGGVQWTFTGSLAPGDQTAVTFQVMVMP